MEDFHNIPVEVAGQSQIFDYNYLDDQDLGKICTITSEGKTLVVDEDFSVINTDMPGNWIDPAIETLKRLLNQDMGLP